MKKKYEIVSLGSNCLVRSILTLHRIKPSKAEGELSCPFDIAIHPITTIIKSIENNFADYFEDFYYHIEKRHIFDFKQKHSCWKKQDGSRYPHDKDCKSNDLDKIIQRYKARIENFNKILDSNTPILFVIYIQDEKSREYMNKLYDTLQKRLTGKKFILAVLDFNGIINETFYPQIKVLNLPNFCENYFDTWYRKKFRKSDLGIFTEKCICEFVQNIIDTDF